MSIVGGYAPGEGNTEETEQFYDELQETKCSRKESEL
jgi:hypothetical protein